MASVENTTESEMIRQQHSLDDVIQLLSSMDESQINDQTRAILPPLGGLKPMLTHYLTTQSLTAAQIHDLHHTLSTNNNPQRSPATSSVAVPISVDENDAGLHGPPSHTLITAQAPPATLERQVTLNVKRQQKKFVVYLNEQNDIWHRLLPPSKHALAEKITAITLHKKWIAVYVSVAFVLSIVCRFWIPLLQALPSLMNVVWMLACLCSFNVSMCKRMLRSFVFWYKLYSWLLAVVAYAVLFRSSWSIEGLNWVSGTLIIVAVSLHDGWRLDRRLKLAVGLMVWLLAAGMYAFVYFEGDLGFGGGEYAMRDRHAVVLGESISVKSVCLNALLNLLIFMAQQLWTMMWYKHKASVLSTRPRIIWVADWSQMQTQLSLQSQLDGHVVDADDDPDPE